MGLVPSPPRLSPSPFFTSLFLNEQTHRVCYKRMIQWIEQCWRKTDFLKARIIVLGIKLRLGLETLYLRNLCLAVKKEKKTLKRRLLLFSLSSLSFWTPTFQWWKVTGWSYFLLFSAQTWRQTHEACFSFKGNLIQPLSSRTVPVLILWP